MLSIYSDKDGISNPRGSKKLCSRSQPQILLIYSDKDGASIHEGLRIVEAASVQPYSFLSLMLPVSCDLRSKKVEKIDLKQSDHIFNLLWF